MSGLGRDRDAAGRPHSARPRDALGRPMPRNAEGAFRVPDDLDLPPAQALAEAQRLFDEGYPFHAHEVLEAVWKSCPQAERDLWQGLAQLAVGLTHVLRGNRLGGARLLRRGSARVRPYAGDPPYGVDAAGLVAWADNLADRLDADLNVDTAPPRLTRA
ncbi:DUF309 domain-containing protein [Carbonactinospora thermoautotrophica]|nr:DUF309 domain-containing protein [Carbonactinospora thermoautotrophica]